MCKIRPFCDCMCKISPFCDLRHHSHRTWPHPGALKQTEHDANKKLRSEELLALSDTIKVLNDDDALELFKKALPSSSAFVQVETGTASQRQQALSIIRGAQSSARPELNFLVLALQGKKVNFGKVIKMIDDMVVTLKAEQQDDNDKKEYCNMQFDLADDKKKGLERSVSNLEHGHTFFPLCD